MASRVPIQSIPSLRDFMLKSKVTALYRTALRSTKPLDYQQRQEVNSLIRHEFDALRNLTDKDHINYNLTVGKRRIDQFKTQLSMQR